MSSRALTELFRGKGAHVDPIACVEDISAELAARHVAGFPHSIGQLVFHMNYWMDYELGRVRGEHPKYPEHNAESFPPSASSADANEWNQARNRFELLLAELAEMGNSQSLEMEWEVQVVQPGEAKVAGTIEAVLWQMVAHNSYHLGQIAMIRRMLGAWPPRAGGDTW